MGINVENILRVADAIEQHSIADLGFNMSDFFGEYVDQSGHNCGTTACVAGWAHAIKHGEYRSDAYVDPDEMAEWLSISDETADHLFYAENHPDRNNPHRGWFGDITASQAVAVLRHLAATGEVDWTIFSPEAA